MEETSTSAYLQPQSGLGDLVNLLPYLEKLTGQAVWKTATNHGYALEPFGDVAQSVRVVVDGVRPNYIEGFTYLKYNKYAKAGYKSIYFKGNDYEYYAQKVRDRYITFYNKMPTVEGNYVVFAPPRAAQRHQEKNNPFECAPKIEYAFYELYRVAKSMPVVVVGKNDKYSGSPPYQHLIIDLRDKFIDLRDKLSFAELCGIIMHAEVVVSQISAITSIAGLFGIPTKFLPAATETPEQHTAHVNGVVWPGQEILQ